MKTMPPPKRRSVGRPKSERPMSPIASFKGSEEFAAWFEGLAEFSRLNASGLIEHALVEFARIKGYPDPPPKR